MGSSRRAVASGSGRAGVTRRRAAMGAGTANTTASARSRCSPRCTRDALGIVGHGVDDVAEAHVTHLLGHRLGQPLVAGVQAEVVTRAHAEGVLAFGDPDRTRARS